MSSGGDAVAFRRLPAAMRPARRSDHVLRQRTFPAASTASLQKRSETSAQRLSARGLKLQEPRSSGRGLHRNSTRPRAWFHKTLQFLSHAKWRSRSWCFSTRNTATPCSRLAQPEPAAAEFRARVGTRSRQHLYRSSGSRKRCAIRAACKLGGCPRPGRFRRNPSPTQSGARHLSLPRRCSRTVYRAGFGLRRER